MLRDSSVLLMIYDDWKIRVDGLLMGTGDVMDVDDLWMRIDGSLTDRDDMMRNGSVVDGIGCLEEDFLLKVFGVEKMCS